MRELIKLQLSACLLTLLASSTTPAAPLTFMVTPPTDLPPGTTIHLAGNFQNWRPDDPAWRLQPLPDGRHALTADFAAGQGLQFKFTLGSWLTVEKGRGGEEIANRLHVVGAADTLHLAVAAWADGQPVRRPHTLSGQVETITVPGFLDGRRVWVYLPPGYTEETERRYPVLYMFDGQNVFDDATSFVGEWRVDESLEDLIGAGQTAPLIVVAVDNGGGARATEYTPWPTARFGAAGGAAHLQAWVEVLLPAINARFRTRTGPEATGLAGSSLGGLMSLYGGFAYPDVFGRIGAFSPSLLIGGEPLLAFCRDQPERPATLYLDMGTREEGNLTDADGNGTDDYIEALRRLTALLAGRGFVGGWDLLAVEDEGAVHNETAWARRFPGAAGFLFPAE